MKPIRLALHGRYAAKHNMCVIIDSSDADIVTPIGWNPFIGSHCTYAKSSRMGKNDFLHRFIMQPPKGYVVDHINGDGLDNRRCNLRICKQAENGANRTGSRKSIKWLGTRWNPHRGRWFAAITKNRKQIYLGSFKNRKDALKARLAAEVKYFGEFSPSRSNVQKAMVSRYAK